MTLPFRFLRVSSAAMLLCFVGAIALPGRVQAQTTEGAEPDSTAAAAPAHVSFVDGAAALERDGQTDDAPGNMPLLAGDRVRTHTGRVEILFADGSTLHLDAHTTVDFQSDDLVRLLNGRIRLSIPGPARDVSYRIDAPSASVEIVGPGEYRVAVLQGAAEDVELAVLRGAADLVNEEGRTPLRAGERAYSRAHTAPSRPVVFNSASWDAFDRWSEARRDERRGVSTQYLPDPVRPYAGAFDRYGSWRYEAEYGNVWYPTVSVGWRPYYRGRWVTLRPYGWTWVGSDPWAWATHHYGRWGVSAGAWFWIPGRSWGPAWVSWAYAPGYVSWCPLGWNNRPIFQIHLNVFNRGYDPWRGWTVVPQRHFGAGYVNARYVAGHRFDARTRASFVPRDRAPEMRGYAVPRAAAPIRVAGTGVRRGSSPVYTNLGPGDSRVGTSRSRVVVGPSGNSPTAGPRTGAAQSRLSSSSGPDGARREYAAPDQRAVPRDSGAAIRGGQPLGGNTQAGGSTLGVPDASGSYAAPERRAVPRDSSVYGAVPSRRSDPVGRSSDPAAGRAAPRATDNPAYRSLPRVTDNPVYRSAPGTTDTPGYRSAPRATDHPIYRSAPRTDSPASGRAPHGARVPDANGPTYRADPYRQAAPAQRAPAGAIEERVGPGSRAVPRGTFDSPRASPAPEYRPAPMGAPPQHRAPAAERPSGRQVERPSARPAEGAPERSRPAGQPSSGTAVRRSGGR